jgi:copper transport protein
VIARWLTALGELVLTGTFLFVPLMLLPAVRRLDALAEEGKAGGRRDDSAVTPEAVDRVGRQALHRLLRLAWIVAALFAVAMVALLIVETATALDGSYSKALGSPLWDRLTGTRRGALWLIRAGLLIVAAGGLGWLSRQARAYPRPVIERWPVWAALGALGGGMLLMQALGSHSAALRGQEGLAVAIDLLHLAAVSIWVGGLVQFGLALMPSLGPLGGPPRTRLLAGLIPRFSVIAGASVAVVALTGLYQTIRLLGGWSAFTEVGWGQALLVKLALFGVLVLIAGFNLFVVSPWLRRLATRFDRPAREVAARVRLHFRRALLGEVAVAMGILVVVGVLTGQSPKQTSGFVANGPYRPIILNQTVQDLKGRLVIAPGRLGLNRFDISVTDLAGKPVSNDTEAVMRFTLLDQDSGVAEAKTDALGGGRYTVTGSYLSTVGLWEAAVIVRRPNVDEVKIPFQFSMTGETGQAEVRENRPAAPIERGRDLYQANCAQCHGTGAKGDGPLAGALNPKPFDLTVHVPLHTDKELTDWISNGVARTAMPAWKDQFTPEEIQAIINYLRQVAEQSQQDR